MGNREEEIPKWRLVYEVLKTLLVGDTLTYQRIAEILGLDPESDRDRKACQSAARRAGQEFIRTEKHAIEAVPHVGYRVVEPAEHFVLARGQRRRSDRALDRGFTIVVNVNLNGMDREAREDTMRERQTLQRRRDFAARDEEKRIKKSVAMQVTRVAVSEAERAAAKAKVEQAHLDPAT